MKLPFFLAFLLAGCGTKHINTPTHPWTEKTQNPNTACGTVPPPAEQVTLSSVRALPARIAVKFAGETSYHFSECAGIAQTGLLVTVARPSASVLVLNIALNGTTTTNGVTALPATQQLEVVDCDANPVKPVFSAGAPFPLAWTATPKASNCASQLLGSYSVNVNADEEAAFDY